MKKQRGLGLIGVLIVISTLIFTVGGVVVWDKEGIPAEIMIKLKI